MRVERVNLPGIGTHVRFPLQSGRWVGVVQHPDGHRELLVYAKDDPDTVHTAVRLAQQEAHELAEMLFSHHNGNGPE